MTYEDYIEYIENQSMRIDADIKPDPVPFGFRLLEVYEIIKEGDMVWWTASGNTDWVYITNIEYYGLNLDQARNKLNKTFGTSHLFVATKRDEADNFAAPIFNKRILSKTFIRKMIK